MHSLISGFEFILRGGFMMYPLLASGLIALTVIFERLHSFARVYQSSAATVTEILENARLNRLDQARELAARRQTPVTAVLSSGLEHFTNPISEMELSMKNRAEEWIPILEKRIQVVDTVITAAPLMGLLGTITGMMASFQVLSEKGVNEPNAITGGVAEALIATATGLVIALVCLVAYNYLTGRVKEFIYDIESAGSRLVELRMASERVTERVGQKSQ
jgi:biopolymer transport protein ExbB